MKQVFLVICLITFVLFSFSNAYSSDSKDNNSQTTGHEGSAEKEAEALINTTDMRYKKTPLNKLGRGVLNVSTCFLEIPASMIRVSKEKDNTFLGVTIGTAQGLFTALLRSVTGVFDAVTFIIPPYSKTLMDPEYAIESLENAQLEDWQMTNR